MTPLPGGGPAKWVRMPADRSAEQLRLTADEVLPRVRAGGAGTVR